MGIPKPHIPLEQIRADVEACRRCPLADGRTQTVFGVGNPNARVLIVGEAPGKNEDLQGEPFVGAAGDAVVTIDEMADKLGTIQHEIAIGFGCSRLPRVYR